MSNELILEVFFIKIKIKGNLKNITENTNDIIDTKAIKNKNKINFYDKDTIYKITIYEKQIILVRDNKEFSHKFIFDIDNITKSEYYIKEINTTIEMPIKTNKLNISDSSIKIEYEIIDNNNKYSYILDME